jgi:hypothetical protein
MRRLPAVLVVLGACIAPEAVASDTQSDDDARIVYHVSGTTVVIHKRSEPIALKPNPEITYFGKAFTYDCRFANGCVVASEAQLQGDATAYTCAYIDGEAMKAMRPVEALTAVETGICIR